MTDVFSDPLDEYQSAFVDPWSHQPRNWGDIPDHACEASAQLMRETLKSIHHSP
jgi:hypothetical protein